jgi:putative hydrolase of the HAD superfamily
MIKAIIFDLDDTLYNEREFVFGAFKEVSDYLADKYKLNETIVYEDIIQIFKEYGRGKIFNMICEKYSIDENISELIKIYRESKPLLNLYKDAEEILLWLKANNYKIGLITDGMSMVQWNKIDALRLKSRVNSIVVSDDLGKDYWKPHEKPYRECIKVLGIREDECMYVGDNPNKDFIGARKLNISTIRIIREAGDHMKVSLEEAYEADYKINSLKDIIKIINILNKREVR